jgi:hypothetical protein
LSRIIDRPVSFVVFIDFKIGVWLGGLSDLRWAKAASEKRHKIVYTAPCATIGDAAVEDGFS